jgi:hypothetical protein
MSHVYEILRHNINYRLNASFTFHNVKVAEFVSIDVIDYISCAYTYKHLWAQKV